MGKGVVFTYQYPPYLSGLKNGSTITPQAGRFYPKGLLKEEVVQNSIRDLTYQAEVAGWVGADVINIHAGGAYNDKKSAIKRLKNNINTWNREPLFHVSSPIEGWQGRNPRKHHDYVAISDFPKFWLKSDLTVEVEAKAKEKAVLKLKNELKFWLRNQTP